MLSINATDMRKNFGKYIDEIVRTKPIFVKRSRDCFMGISIEMAKELVKDVTFTVDKYIEKDNSVTLSLNGFDLVVNEKDETTAINSLIKDFREYALEYYKDIEFWSSDINRRNQMKSILKVLLTDNDEEIRESFVCQVGKN
ncbi:hypothetical protein [Sporanaerobacter sp. PP17-6a]|mgnify:FL=1|jgi:hypothetical protein|uniref:hypothetical protein n=1 Tax=Sporanaerobacter sp. PP17-6a TaxID=1891289 RepID=UPI0008A077E9|nr:hypothetical protein [Sporanaerobacter sp. PP17-6a]MBE6082108.1 hypothetical protein [Tissierellaceae bacterium]SCL86856.1 hypothetical protein PP176A_1174 [Sporanaerobacter sp. PP17-6a]